jgi:hypothetical protein
VNHLVDHLFVSYQKQVGCPHLQMVVHALESSAFHRDNAIIGRGKHTGEKRVDTACAGNNAQVKICGAESLREALPASTQLHAGVTEDEVKTGYFFQPVRYLAAIVWR